MSAWIVEPGTLTVSAPCWKGGNRPRVPVCYPQGTFNQEENMRRIVECVNACADIDDPAAMVADWRRLLREEAERNGVKQ